MGGEVGADIPMIVTVKIIIIMFRLVSINWRQLLRLIFLINKGPFCSVMFKWNQVIKTVAIDYL